MQVAVAFAMGVVSQGSALLPRQPVKPPSIQRAAMVGVVELAFEAVEDVDHVGEAGRFEREAGVDGADAAAADE